MRLLMTTDTVGGVWTFTQELTAGLLGRGCAVHLVSLGLYPSGAQSAWCDSMRLKWRENFGFSALDMPLEWMDENSRAYDEAAPFLVNMACAFRADLLHSNQFCFGALPLTIPKIVTAHSDVFSWARACRGTPLKESPWLAQYRRLVNRGLAGADVVVAPTQSSADSLTREFYFTGTPVVIHNGCSLRPHEARDRALQAITAGRLWDEAKNVAMLSAVDSPMPILIAGEAGEHAVDLPIQTRVLGPLSPDDLHSVFRASAVYLCTSRYEPFGLAPLEAALCGCAVLANDIPSLREVWAGGALYFSDAASLSSLLRHLCLAPEALAAAQRRSLRRALRFSAIRMTGAYLLAYRSALDRAEEALPCHAASA